MKHGLLYITIFFCLINNAYGMESKHISISGEVMEDGHASSIRIYSDDDGGVYGGLSLNYITSSTVIQHNYRKTIVPIYAFMGFRAPWRLSPFIEVGIDLPETIIEEIRSKEDEEDPVSEVDYYYSGGFKFSITDTFSFSLYAKKYNFIFREYAYSPKSSPLFKSRPTSYGMGISMRF